jgi:hypothetical protein
MKQMDCNSVHGQFEELLFEPEAVSALVRSHVDTCATCSAEITALRSTMAVLDAWQVPEPNPYFLTRLEARLREEREAEPTGWLARQLFRFRAGFVDGPRPHLRPLAATSLTVLLLIGGGTYLNIVDWNHPAQQEAQTAVVSDLETMDSNAQVLDRLESLSSEDNN